MSTPENWTPYFESGDVVVLNSGGPHMTVICLDFEADEDGEDYLCCWFNDDGDYREDVFSVHTIHSIDESLPN